MPLRSEVEYGSLLAYTPRSATATGARSQRFVHELKRDAARGAEDTTARFVARRMREELGREAAALGAIFDATWIAVPVPRSSLTRDGDLWPAERIATALLGEGLVRSTQSILRRSHPVTKSATAESKDRPTAAQHYASMTIALSDDAKLAVRAIPTLVRAELGESPKLLLVDDVITRGATMLAASSVLLDAIPDAVVLAFAVVRTNSDLPETPLFAPIRGRVRLRGESTFRRP